MLDRLVHDVRYGFRALRSSRGVSALVIAALALGIGANTAIFTITNALVLRSLPVRDPAGLLNVEIGNFMSWGYIEANNSFTWRLWQDLARKQDVLTGLFAYAENRFDVVLNGETRQVTSAFVDGPMFSTLGLAPVAGRTFDTLDPRRPPAEIPVVISYALWTREFASDPSVPGRTLILEGRPLVIAGVLPSRFFGLTAGHSVDVYLPIAAEPYIRGADSALESPIHYFLQVYGRLRDGVPRGQAQERIEALSTMAMRETLPTELPERVRGEYLLQRYNLLPASAGVSYIRSNLEMPLAVLSAIAGLLLVLTCLTVANLVLAKGTARQKEIGVRVALGAGRGRIARQLLFESLMLALAGAAAGIVIARFTAAFLVRSYSASADPLILDLAPDGGVFGFALGLAVFSAVVFGLVPALRASQGSPAESLRGGRSTASASLLGIRRVLLAGQLAVSVVLVTGAVLFGMTLRNLLTVDRGFQSDRVLLADIDLRRAKIDTAARAGFYGTLLGRMQALPLVESASLCYVTPISGRTWQFDVNAATASGPRPVHIHYNAVTSDYFATFRTAILAGRGLSPFDRRGSAPVALVNQSLARAAFGTTDVIGRRITMLDPERRTVEIVGIVQDAKYRSLRRAVPPTLYDAMPQLAEPPGDLSIAIRSRTSVAPVMREVGALLMRDYPALSFEMRSFDAQISDSIARDRAFAVLCGLFGVLALVLAAIGIYGVLSYFIAQRQAEIGIRMALGATPAGVRRLVYRQSLVTCTVGVAAGTLVAFWGARYTEALLYGVAPGSAYVYSAAALAIALIAALATAIPAIRASRIDSIGALRCE